MFSGSPELSQKSLQMKQDDKLIFSKAFSRESSVANPSLRVYYGGASGAVPFMWESRPGTPKHHTLSDTALVPPLTPPPSYYSSSNNKKSVKKNNSRSNLFYALFPKIRLRKTNASPSRTSASFSSSDSSLFSPITTTKLKGRKRFLSQGSSFDSREDHDDGTVRSPTSTLCFGIGRVLASSGSTGPRG
ncbi:hypothetical protein I3843_10G155900 [Carya illinoinensis]|uniref:Uncharacterized protein n=1 Tax=Carya illinoinensis TaxID=32201 RepID=A0A8T1PIK5_CARIL|nr:uncharacterized protein LOC122279970 [Carya illinoinensis]KAG2686146.1 hypothetical protein I3760_10G164100 [Carya illinoinensis]KAG6640300.1 hypothetical protein CIPAW_10G163800 [Carya illinoinensis]KAG6693276.1 hypothetical protein I3842_10G161400 [Carya illinoinensis]KAG7960978.1 hypothetical protein I3843_10G155900 [Carya illinoinensis]